MLRAIVLAATALCAACPQPGIRIEHPAVDPAARLAIARAEARRADGIAELVERAHHGDVATRRLALRGLGRIGGTVATRVLREALGDAEPAIVDAAADAIGVMASLDDLTSPELTAALVAALPHAHAQFVIGALGRAGDASALPVLVTQFAGDPVDAALALGRFGRRKLALNPEARAALVRATSDVRAPVRYAATYALVREFQPPADDAAIAALIARVDDDEAETRALAIAGLGKRGAIEPARGKLEHALLERDWRVAVEAVRAMAGEHGDELSRAKVIEALATRERELLAGSASDAQVVIEALRELLPHAQLRVPQVVVDQGRWIDCLGELQRARTAADLARCSALPKPLALALFVELAKAGEGDRAAHSAWLRALLELRDPRGHAAALDLLAATWKEGDDADHRTGIAQIAAALGSSDLALAGSAVDVVSQLHDSIAAAERGPLDAAIVARAQRERDVELSAALYEAIGKDKIAAGADTCRAGLDGAPVRARAAAECLRTLGDAVPVPPVGRAEPPPVDVQAVIGKHVLWHLDTERGAIEIELRPDVAPWNVATIVSLARRGFYNGTELHRVVPNFVVQGGDPTGTGAGGPGFTTPAEPAGLTDASDFTRGAVGIADAGRDSGGSQFFVMHSAAPHLDGRYTWIGVVVRGQDVVDALEIGDRVRQTTVEIR